MYPGSEYGSFALSTDLCTSHSSSICGEGGLWDVQGGQTGKGYTLFYENVVDETSSSGIYMTGPTYAQNLNIGTGGNSQTAPNASIAAVNIGNQTLPNGNRIDLEVGVLVLGADDQQQVFSTGLTQVNESEISTWIFPGYLYNQSLTKSYSYSLHIGSTAFDYPGSMLYGGYDKGRAIGPGTTYGDSPPQLQDIVLGVETGGSPWSFDSKKGLLLTNTSQNEPIAATPDSIAAQLFLPKQTCDNLAKQLPVTFDSSGYYLWNTNDPTYYNITTSAAYLGFVFPPATGGTEDVTIKVPFQLLVLNLTTQASGRSGKTPYFPCLPYDPSDGGPYILGRAFLQAAFWGRNWNNHVSWLAQAPGPGTSKSGLGQQLIDIEDSDTTLDFYTGDQYFQQSWNDYWSPLPGGRDDSTTNGGNNNSSGLSTGAQAGIGAGAGVVGLALIGALIFFCLRRRKQRKGSKTETASANEPFVGGAPHYGTDAKANPQPYQDQQQYGHYQPSGMGDQPYSPYKSPGAAYEGGESYEMSGTIRAPAQELPGHEITPSELEQPGPKFERQPGTAM
jgi:hypothetical protein